MLNIYIIAIRRAVTRGLNGPKLYPSTLVYKSRFSTLKHYSYYIIS